MHDNDVTFQPLIACVHVDLQTMRDLRASKVDILTLGQYLRPTDYHLAVVEYVTPEKFDYYAREGRTMGFKYVASGPMVRSSYKAGELFLENMIRKERAVEGKHL